MSERAMESVVRVELKRANASELVKVDRVLLASVLVKALGTRADEVLSKAVVRRYPDKSIICQQNDEGQSLFLVLAGEARLFTRRQSDMIELGFAHKGDVFGEGEVLAGTVRRQASAVANGPVDLAEVPRDALLLSRNLPTPIARALEGVKREREAQLDQMADFLNRW